MALSPASLQNVITRHQPWQMMHMKEGLYFSTDIPKEQTTLNPTFLKGRLLGAKEWCDVVWCWGGGGGKSVQRGRFCERWSLWFLASLSCLPPTDQHLSNEGATSSKFKKSAFNPRIYIFCATSEQTAIISLHSTDWIVQPRGAVFTARYGLNL
jgi:hypothetical protein